MTATELAFARSYLRQGWRVIPVEAGAKECYLKGWKDLALTVDDLPHYFSGDGNLAVVLGPPA